MTLLCISNFLLGPSLLNRAAVPRSVQMAVGLLDTFLPTLHQEPLRVELAHAPPELGSAAIPEHAALALAIEKLGHHLGREHHLVHALVKLVYEFFSDLLPDLHRRQVLLHHVRKRADDMHHLSLNHGCNGNMG